MTTSENLPGSHAALNHPPTENVAAEPRQADPTHGKPSEVFQTFYGFQAISPQSGFLHGLKLAAVAVVAQAVWTMAVKLCPGRERVTLALVAACAVLGSSIAWLQLVVLAAGALFGWRRTRSASTIACG